NSSPPVRTRTSPGRMRASSGACRGSTPISPVTSGTITISAWPEWISFSALTMSTCMVEAISRCAPSQFLRLLGGLVDGADHVERLLRQRVVLAVDDTAEAADGFFERHILARRAGEHLGDEERLAQEPLDLARARHREFVVFGQLVHAEDGDDVLQFFIALQRLLHVARDAVVLLADDVRVDLAARRVERIDRGIDAELGDLARQHH